MNVLVEQGGDGLVADPGGSLDVRHATIAGNSGVGVNNTGGAGASVTSSIVYGNVGGDLLGVPCGAVSRSDTAAPDCSAANANIAAPPLFGSGFRLMPSSPCIDRELDPAAYAGQPLTDLAGALRLRDFDGDGFAQGDMGAFEEVNGAIEPGEVMNVRWLDPMTLGWDSVPGATEYHVYRGEAPFSYGSFGMCVDPLDANRTDLTVVDPGVPPPGAVRFYHITVEDGLGREGTVGFAAGAERSNFTPCP